jgi:PAS domain S-box-containing protein
MPEAAAENAGSGATPCLNSGCRALLERSLAGVFRIETDGRVQECNPALARMLEYSSPQEVVDQPAWTCDAGDGPENLAACLLRHRDAPGIELCVTGADGSPRWLMVAVAAVEQDSIQATALDITEATHARAKLDRYSRLCAMVSELHRAATDAEDKFQEACRIVVETGGFQKACVAVFHEETGALELIAQAAAKDGRPAVEPCSRLCPATATLLEGRSFVCDDVPADPAMEPFRADDARCGFRSLAALPVHVQGRVAAGFWVFSTTPGRFDSEIIEALKGFTFHIGFQLEIDGNNRLVLERGRAEARFRELLEAAPDAILETDRAGTIIVLNAAAEHMFGYAHDELIGHCVDVLVPERLRQSHADHRAAYVTEPVSRTIKAPDCPFGRRKDGSEFPVEISLSPVVSQSGFVTCIVRDVTHRRQAEQALRESTLQIASILESITDGFFALDRDWRFSYLNRKAEQLLGRTRADLIGRVIWEEFPDQVGSVFFTEYRKAIEERIPVEFSAIFPPAGIWAEFHAYPSENGLSVYFQDITERKHLEERLQQSQKLEALGRLAGGVAHDFNNLLTIIGGYAQMILESTGRGDPVRKDVGTILEAANRASGLTRQLLAFSRRQMVQPKLLDLNGVVQKMNKMLRRLIREDVELVLALEPGLGQVKIDPGQIEQVLMNLVVNARDAMPTGGRLTVATTSAVLAGSGHETGADLPPGRYAVLSVADTGTGMDTNVLSRIFEPFFTTKAKHKGTGLGLATVYGIVKQSGGDILVDTEPGKGTVFRIFLPWVERVRETCRPHRKARGQHRGTETILLVEDEPDVRRLAGDMLRSQGYNVLEAANGAEAIRVWQTHGNTVDLLVTDVIMPQMSGPQLAEKLVAERPGLRVLYISGYTDDIVAQHGISGSGNTLLQKPFTRKRLGDRVRKLLDSRP